MKETNKARCSEHGTNYHPRCVVCSDAIQYEDDIKAGVDVSGTHIKERGPTDPSYPDLDILLEEAYMKGREDERKEMTTLLNYHKGGYELEIKGEDCIPLIKKLYSQEEHRASSQGGYLALTDLQTALKEKCIDNSKCNNDNTEKVVNI